MNVKMKFSDTHRELSRSLELDYDGEPGPAFDAVVLTFIGQWTNTNRVMLTAGPGKMLFHCEKGTKAG